MTKAWNAKHSMIPTEGRDVPKGTHKAWNAKHSMIPTEGRDVPKGTHKTCQKEPSPVAHMIPKRSEGHDEGHAQWHRKFHSLPKKICVYDLCGNC